MKRLLFRRSAVGLALGALAATGLASVPSPAQAAVSNAWVNVYADVHDDAGGSCVATPTGSSPSDVAWSDNGLTVTHSYAETGTVTAPGNDVTTMSSSATSSVSSTPLGAAPATIKATGSVSASAVPNTPATVCDGHASASTDVDGDFVLPQPMWATVTVTGTGTGGAYTGGYVEIDLPDGSLYLQATKRSQGTVTALLPAGSVGVSVETWIDAYGGEAGRNTGSFAISANIDLQPVGAGSAVSGKGKAYAQFGARDCATGNISAAITKKAKKKAKQVLVKVNGAKVAKLKGKKLKKRTLVLPAAPGSAAEVTATIKLKNGKKVTVTRSYLACS
ncbi:hypothetical protein [Nocardioides humi]|uniref:Uncharacterized protein n=1 Tax=Nocardioides humi TaxID=449461 RepID=A0ABN2BFR4_9ACTN|nr:hypothetical protein [Nocardioides humi]